MKSKEDYLQSFRAKEREKLLDNFKKDIKKESIKTKNELKAFFKSKEFKNLFKEYLNENSYWNLINNDDYINFPKFISLYDEYVEIYLKNEERTKQKLLEMERFENEWREQFSVENSGNDIKSNVKEIPNTSNNKNVVIGPKK